jgi:hypothetical protein
MLSEARALPSFSLLSSFSTEHRDGERKSHLQDAFIMYVTVDALILLSIDFVKHACTYDDDVRALSPGAGRSFVVVPSSCMQENFMTSQSRWCLKVISASDHRSQSLLRANHTCIRLINMETTMKSCWVVQVIDNSMVFNPCHRRVRSWRLKRRHLRLRVRTGEAASPLKL